MRNKYLLIILILFSSCNKENKKKEVGYNIGGQIINSPDSLSVKISNEQFRDSTMLIDGKFSFSGITVKPQRVVLKIENASDNKPFWLENAQIDIKGDYDKLELSQVIGGENQRISNILRDRQKSILKLMNEYASQWENNSLDITTRDSVRDTYKLLSKKLDAVKIKFVKEYPNTLESVILLGINRSQWNKDSVRTIFSTMDLETKNTEWGTLISEYLRLPTNPQISERYIDVPLQNTDDETVNLSQLTGTFTLIDFWASWCIPCREENPNLVELFKKYNIEGFKIIGVSMDRDKSAWLKAIKDDGLPWGHLIDSVGLESNNIFLLYDVRFIPDNLLVDQDGIILARNLRGGVLEKKLKDVFSH